MSESKVKLFHSVKEGSELWLSLGKEIKTELGEEGHKVFSVAARAMKKLRGLAAEAALEQ